jgi:glutaredoxin/glutathione-dependent peroxiredoxin
MPQKCLPWDQVNEKVIGAPNKSSTLCAPLGPIIRAHFQQKKAALFMSIKIGDQIPSAQLTVMNDGPKPISSSDVFGAGTTVLFSVPGAFTPTCSARHLPGFVDHFAEFKAKGIDRIACMAVNDAFVMDAWGKSQKVGEIMMLADGNAEFTKALGLELDATKFGMGVRAQRFALVSKDGVVSHLFIEAPGEFKVSAADHVLAQL